MGPGPLLDSYADRMALQGPSDALISGPSMPARDRRE
jgi:hypothetical protein